MGGVILSGICKTEPSGISVLKKSDAEEALIFVLKRIDANLPVFCDSFPAPASRNGIYEQMENVDWTASFWTGMLWLAYEATGSVKYRDAASKQVESFKARLKNDICMETHDIGFLYTLSCVADYKLIGDEQARRTAVKAADRLMKRYLEKPGIIQAWGSLDDPQNRGRMIIDCLMNLPLLYWAGENTGEKSYGAAALRHAQNAAKYLVRPDFSTFHTYYMDAETGKPKFGRTQQGLSDKSCWARGQAWGIYGFSISYLHTGNKNFFLTAEKLADYFLAHLPPDRVCGWDLSFTDISAERDSSAAAIAVCGLLELVRHMPLLDPKRMVYENAALQIVASLIGRYLAKDEKFNGVLLHSMYSKPENKGVDECTIWGDYFFMEALVRLTRFWRCYW